MAPDIVSAKPEAASLALRWSGRMSLAGRILAVNILPIGLLAASFFYLDGFRTRLIAERRIQAESEARLIAEAVQASPPILWRSLVDRLDEGEDFRIRVIDKSGLVIADSWSDGKPNFELRDPATENWQRKTARMMDEAVDLVVDAEVPPSFVAHEGRLPLIPPGSFLSLAPDRSHMIEALAPLDAGESYSVVTLRNARDIRRLVRAERSQLGYMIAVAALISILLSLFLARTIVRPLRILAHAATQVRFGQAREVSVPRLPSRRDEIGKLARSVSDMSHALRRRMDAVEAFAADVAHEIKNPLASLSSAVQALPHAKKPEQKDELHRIISDDVLRLDRLITDISDLSRIDANIARARFETVDLGSLIEAFMAERTVRLPDNSHPIAFARPQAGTTKVRANITQMRRVIENLVDNAISFSPPNGSVRIAATRADDRVVLTVDDDGPGIPEDRREAIFERFHSDRPEAEFGRHSGLGLAIARTIINAHDGDIRVANRESGQQGACFIISLPLAKTGP
jgi:two-component system, OmpR family, sensor histidine kinase ChvG